MAETTVVTSDVMTCDTFLTSVVMTCDAISDALRGQGQRDHGHPLG